jgi:hypothetical protein
MPEDDKPDDKDAKEAASLKKRLTKHEGDAMALAAELTAENADLHRQLRESKKDKPAEGSLVLTAEQAKQWNDVLALGKPEDLIATYQAYVAHGKPDEIKTKLEQRDTLEAENTLLKKTQLLQQIADEENPKLKFSVLRDLDIRDGGLQYEKRDVTVDGKTVQAWHVKRDNKWVPLSTQKEQGGPWADYKGVLELTESKASGTPVPGQKPDDKGQKPNLYSRIRQESAERQKKEKETNIPLEKRLNLVA